MGTTEPTTQGELQSPEQPQFRARLGALAGDMGMERLRFLGESHMPQGRLYFLLSGKAGDCSHYSLNIKKNAALFGRDGLVMSGKPLISYIIHFHSECEEPSTKVLSIYKNTNS